MVTFAIAARVPFMIELRCPSCRESIKLDESFTGRRVACVGCAKEFTVPDLEKLAAAKASPSTPATRTKAASPVMSAAKPAQPDQTLLDKARKHRELVMGGLIVVVLGAAGLVFYSSMQSGGTEDGSGSQVTNANSEPATSTDRTVAAIDGGTTNRPTPRTPANSSKYGRTKTTKPIVDPGPPSTNDKPTENKPPETLATAQPVIPQVSSADYTSKTDTLLRHSAELDDWATVTRSAEISAGTELALPAPFESRLEVGHDLYEVHVLGGTRTQLINSSDDVPFGFELRRGRLIIKGRRTGDVPGAALTLGVRGAQWRLELIAGDTLFGIEIVPRRPQQFEEDFGNDNFTGGIFVVKGSVRLIDAAGETRVVAGNSWLSLAQRDRIADKTADDNQPRRLLPLPQFRPLPDWLDLDTRVAKPATRNDAELFTGLFNRQQQFGEAIKPLLAATDEQTVRMAVECQSLLGHRVALLQTLSDSEYEAARQAAIDGLRDQMPQTRQDRDKFQQELAEVFGKGAKAIYPLLWGYPEEEVRKNKFTCFQLVDWLMHDNLTVRELAWAQITSHATARYAYKPAGSLRSRRVAAKKWQQHIAKTDSILGDEL